MEASVPAELLACQLCLGERRWRGLVWLSGEVEDVRARGLALWHALGVKAPLWVGPEPPAGLEAAAWLPAAKARNRLGGEHDLIVFDALSPGAGFDPDAFGALSGTLRAGGLLVLLTPDDWGARPDADYARLAAHPHAAEALSAHYLARLARLLEASPRTIRWPAQGVPMLPDWPEASPSGPAAEPAPDDGDCLTADQAEAVARLVRLRRRRPLVLTADRGRGKTAALGIACARLLAKAQQDGAEIEILVTAPRPAAVAGLFERLAALCPEGRRQGNRFEDAGGRVTFLAPDELSARVARGEAGGAGTWLLVDEAAAMPAGLLGQWLSAFPRIAFATTVHGYEGAGRGFALRFRARLERLTPEWREYHLSAPIRWAEDDPLEALTSRLLMLDAEPVAPDDIGSKATAAWRVESPEALAHDEPRLRTLFGLLVQAHYRTTPSDLRHLLDGPDTRVVTLGDAAGPAAVAVVADEGGFDAALAERVARGERRPRGHLMAQSLAAHAGSREALTGRLRRVQRIAVHPAARRRGLGRELLTREREAAGEAGVALLGASFGAEPGLLAFWRAQGFRTVRLGLTREAATGEHAVMVVAPAGEGGEALAERLASHFQALLPSLLAFELKALDPAVALALLAEGEPRPLDDAARRDLEDVAHGHRDPALVRPAIQALIRLVAAREGTVEADADLTALAAWAFQGRDTAWLAARLGLAGGKAVDAWRRQQVARRLAGPTLSSGRGEG
ncbi:MULTISPECIES: tRNA(Met) cytidine acetyltransferase TmcA [Halomonas]|uniref:tRNA(Met) cytidine acetyltransferase TmcA n=1 Tax=Halomonas halophila TaxID=29573 RepID=A0ABQ0U464_9GAMM|nr:MULTISPECIES: GNAT family N-acetyltransferase [Halomonas]MDR5890678.1 GNAT family N-acetyltransferase [Halomonas salina]WJY07601.1 GNAT family N-acetyltransferase [Halomonas halophila]GEK73233.1 tRNA(Met) cytidine acetyltransferase TmcA [Halomonas halophila]